MCTLDRTGRKGKAGRIPPHSYRYENKIKKIPRLKDKNQASVTSRHDKLVGLLSYGSSVPACPGQSPCSRLIYTAMITPVYPVGGFSFFESIFSYTDRVRGGIRGLASPRRAPIQALPRFRDPWFVMVCRSRGTNFLWGLCAGECEIPVQGVTVRLPRWRSSRGPRNFYILHYRYKV